MTVLDLVRAMGYDVRFEGFMNRQEVALLGAFRRLDATMQALAIGQVQALPPSLTAEPGPREAHQGAADEQTET